MRYLLFMSITIAALVKDGAAPPPRRTEQLEQKHPETVSEEPSKQEQELGLEYERYLKEVIDALESDVEFKKKLEAADENDIRSGKIAHELDFVGYNVRSKLDEVKRQELERLRHLAMKEFELTNGIDVDHMKIGSPQHVDHENPHTFEIDDLKKLIAKVTSDLSAADETRHDDFKEYEMKKEYEKQEKLKHLEGEEKIAFEKQIKENETKHKQHDPLHHPGSKQQLEEVWEKQDHMDKQEFDPKVFFALHDLDGNGYWDQNEVKALFLKELDKMYQAGAPEDDMRERAEEMERMREHVFRETDKNKDQLISFEEFLETTKDPEFNKDPGWETVDQKPAYTDEEYRRYAEIQQMVQQGLIPPAPVYYPVYPNYQHPQIPPGQHPQQFQQHPGQFQQHPGQFQHHPGQVGQHPVQYQQPHPAQVGHQPVQYQQPHPAQVGQHPGDHPAQYQQPHPGQEGLHPAQYQQPHPGQGGQHPAQYQQPHPAQVGQHPGDHPAQYQQGHPVQQPHPAQTGQQYMPQQPVAHPAQYEQQHGNQQAHPAQAQQNLHPPQYQAVQGQHPPQYQQHPDPAAQFQQNQGQHHENYPNNPPQGQQHPVEYQQQQQHPTDQQPQVSSNHENVNKHEAAQPVHNNEIPQQVKQSVGHPSNSIGGGKSNEQSKH